jgi:hypothetical protein
MSEDNELTIVNGETGAVEDPNEAGMILKDDHHGGSGLDLLDQGASIVKLDARGGKMFYSDAPDDRFDHLDMTILDYRIFFRKFGDNGPVCSSDDGKRGFDQELEKWKECKSCPFYHGLKNFQGEGQCGLGGTLQAITVNEGHEFPVQMNLSRSSVRSFKTYCTLLERKGKKLGQVTTQVRGRFVKARYQYWAAEFEMVDDTPVVEIQNIEE